MRLIRWIVVLFSVVSILAMSFPFVLLRFSLFERDRSRAVMVFAEIVRERDGLFPVIVCQCSFLSFSFAFLPLRVKKFVFLPSLARKIFHKQKMVKPRKLAFLSSWQKAVYHRYFFLRAPPFFGPRLRLGRKKISVT